MDVLVNRVGDAVHARKGGEVVPIDVVHVDVEEKRKRHLRVQLLKNLLLDAFFSSDPYADSVVVEVFVEYKHEESAAAVIFHPARLRLDKTTPNHIHVVSETVAAAIEGMTAEELSVRIGAAPEQTATSDVHRT